MTAGAEEDPGGRVFFSNIGRSLEVEDEIRLLSVGVDIGSATSHLAFSRVVLERTDTRYIVAERTVLHESDVLLTPFRDDGEIDAEALGRFIRAQYARAGVDPQQVDTGALILTGVAVRRQNARAIAEIFADEAGRFVSVSAGDSLETILAAFGSGAAARSLRDGVRVMNVDIGGGTSKIAVCEAGEVVALTALDVGARVVAFDDERRIARIEEAGRHFARAAGIEIEIGAPLSADAAAEVAGRMADRLFEAMGQGELSAETRSLLRLDPLPPGRLPDIVTFSGGVSEFVYGDPDGFGDLGRELGQHMRQRLEGWGPRLEAPVEGIRATVIGASQYTIQVSGSTIFVDPPATLPLRNLLAIRPAFNLSGDVLDPAGIAAAIGRALVRLDADQGDRPVAVCYRWDGSASYHRLDAFCRGVSAGLANLAAAGHPIILVGESDVGGLVGLHLAEELRHPGAVVSIDGVELEEFDFVDIGALLEASGAVPVVVKSLVFPTTARLGRDGADDAPKQREAVE